MNEQDKQAFETWADTDDARKYSAEWQAWQAALEYARGQQEPVAWLCEWDDWHQYHDAKDPLPNEWDDAPDKITPLYTHPAQPVQPAGVQGDAVHFRAVLCSEQQNRAVGVVPKVVGFVDRKAAEQFILEKRDFQGWKYNLESLYTTPPAHPVQPAGAQGEPVAWRPILQHPIPWVTGKPQESDIRHWTSQGCEIEYAYTHPAQPVQPAGVVNEQLLDACKSVQNRLRPKTELREKIDAAIAAAEAAKGGV